MTNEEIQKILFDICGGLKKMDFNDEHLGEDSLDLHLKIAIYNLLFIRRALEDCEEEKIPHPNCSYCTGQYRAPMGLNLAFALCPKCKLQVWWNPNEIL